TLTIDNPTGVQVSVEDASGNVVTTDTSNVTIAIGTNPGSATLSGTATVAADAGVAMFTTLSIDKTGTGYTLTATDAALTLGTSSAFNITTGLAAKLTLIPYPTLFRSTLTIDNPTGVQVSVEDASGNVVTTDTSNVTIAIG